MLILKVHVGRLTRECLKKIVPGPFKGNRFYFCGPPAFLAHVKNLLKQENVDDKNINFEFFGPTQ